MTFPFILKKDNRFQGEIHVDIKIRSESYNDNVEKRKTATLTK